MGDAFNVASYCPYPGRLAAIQSVSCRASGIRQRSRSIQLRQVSEILISCHMTVTCHTNHQKDMVNNRLVLPKR